MAAAELEPLLDTVEQRLSALGESLLQRDPQAIDLHAGELHRALAQAVQRFQLAARQGGVPPALRERLAVASGLVATQRESLARATAALDRAIDVLMPGNAGATYGAHGGAQRSRTAGLAQA